MTSQIFVAILGIFAGSATIVIVALVGFIGKDLKTQIQKLGEVVFLEMGKKQDIKICDLKMAQAEKDNKRVKKDIDNVASIARAAGGN